MSFDEALQRADTTRFIVAGSPNVDRDRSAADWLRRMAAHRAVVSATGERGTQWGRAPSTHRRADVLDVPPEPETVGSSTSDDDADVFRLAADHGDVLRLAFIVVDVLLLSYHVTRTCCSAHALWTVGLRQRVTGRAVDVASVRFEARSARAPAVVMTTGSGGELAGGAATGGYDGGPPQMTSDASLSNHLETARPPSSTWSNHSAVNLHQCCPQPTTACSLADRKSIPLKARRQFISLNLSPRQSLFER